MLVPVVLLGPLRRLHDLADQVQERLLLAQLVERLRLLEVLPVEVQPQRMLRSLVVRLLW